MIIVDTSVWIEFLRKNDKIFLHLEEKIQNREAYAIEPVFGELLQGARGQRENDIIKLYWNYLPKVEEKNIWIEAGIYSSTHKLISKGVGLIDSIIIILAKKTQSKIWTLDKKLKAVLSSNEKYAL